MVAPEHATYIQTCADLEHWRERALNAEHALHFLYDWVPTSQRDRRCSCTASDRCPICAARLVLHQTPLTTPLPKTTK